VNGREVLELVASAVGSGYDVVDLVRSWLAADVADAAVPSKDAGAGPLPAARQRANAAG
jgi:hypothetical protein